MRQVRGVWWCGWLAAVGVAVVGARAEDLPADASEGRGPEAPSLRIEHVDILQKPAPVVRLRMTAPAEPLTRTLPAQGRAPARIYVDVPGVLAPGIRKLIAGRDPLLRVRTAQFASGTARIVIELRRSVPFAVGTAGRTVTIALGEGAPPAPAEASPAAPKRAGRREQLVQALRSVAPRAASARSQPSPPPEPPRLAEVSPPVEPLFSAVTESDAIPLVSEPLPPDEPAPLSTATEPPVASPAPVVAATLPAPVVAAPPPAPVIAPPAPVVRLAPAPPAAEPTVRAPEAVRDAASPSPLARVRGVNFVWPALDAPEYQGPEVATLRRLLLGWQKGAMPTSSVSRPTASPAALYLAADLVYLETTAGRTDHLAAAQAYARALREAPDFGDVPRALFMLGQVNLAAGFGPEASSAFGRLVRQYPDSPLVPCARLGEVAALRIRRRLGEARHALDGVLAGAHGDLLCHARHEEVLLGRAGGEPAAAAEAFRRLAASCPDALEAPGALADYAEALLAAGDRDGVHALLAGQRAARADAEEARLHMLAGALFAEAENAYRAREEYDDVIHLQPGGRLALEARMRLALLDADRRPERLTEALTALAAEPAPPALRAAMLGEAAEANARAGRYEEALALLDQAAALGPAGQAQADGRRAELFGRWITALRAQDDLAGLATVYAAYATDIEELVTVEDRLVVAGALGGLGLHSAAAGLLQRPAQHAPEAAVALAEEALAAGDVETTRVLARRLAGAPLPPELTQRLRRAAAAAALAAGDADAAAADATAVDDPELRVRVASAVLGLPGGAERARELVAPVIVADAPPVRALLVAGAAAAAGADWDGAAEAYGRALERATGPERTEASAGLARAARARGDESQARAALVALRGAEDAVARRAAAAVGQVVAWQRPANASGGPDAR